MVDLRVYFSNGHFAERVLEYIYGSAEYVRDTNIIISPAL